MSTFLSSIQKYYSFGFYLIVKQVLNVQKYRDVGLYPLQSKNNIDVPKMSSKVIEIEESSEEEEINQKDINQMKSLIIKAVKYAKKNQKFLPDISGQLEKQIKKELESPEPAIVVFYFLLEKMNEIPNSNLKTHKAYQMVAEFFRDLTVPFNKALEAEFREVIKNILEPNRNAFIVPNLWTQRTMTYDCYCLKTTLQIREELCYRCGRKCHVNCFWPRQKTQKYFQCPVCFLTNCFPHKPVDEIFFLGFLEHKQKENVEYKMKFYIDMNRENINNVEVRCIRLDAQNRFQITFPQECYLKISNKNIKEFEPLASTSPLKRRNQQEVLIDRYLLTYLNTLSLYQKNEVPQRGTQIHDNHLILIASTTPRSIPRLLARSFQKQKLSYEDSKEILKSYMRHPSNDCQIQKLNVSMRCQYYSTRILTPARSIQCTTHYQPFDLQNFVQASLLARSSVQSWRCPICKKRAYDLIVDEYLLKLIQIHGDIIEITFNNEGEPISMQKESQLTDTQDFTIMNESCSREEKKVQEMQHELQEEKSLKDMNPETKEEAEPIVIEIQESQEESVRQMKRTFEQRQVCQIQIVESQEKGRKFPPPSKGENKDDQGKQEEKAGQKYENNRIDVQQNIPQQQTKEKVINSFQNSNVVSTNNQFSIAINGKQTSKKSQHKQICQEDEDDEVVQSLQMKKIENDLTLSHKNILQEIQLELKKGALTKIEQINFNILCRELSHFKSDQT